MSSKRTLTTSSAACFSATNSTFLPAIRLAAIRLVMVWLFPVPGGPCSTKLRPLVAATTACSCEPSAAIGKIFLVSSVLRVLISLSPLGSRKARPGLVAIWVKTGEAINFSQRSLISFHMLKVEKLAMNKYAVCDTFISALVSTSSRLIAVNTCKMSISRLSSGSSLSVASVKPYSFFSHSDRQ